MSSTFKWEDFGVDDGTIQTWTIPELRELLQESRRARTPLVEVSAWLERWRISVFRMRIGSTGDWEETRALFEEGFDVLRDVATSFNVDEPDNPKSVGLTLKEDIRNMKLDTECSEIQKQTQSYVKALIWFSENERSRWEGSTMEFEQYTDLLDYGPPKRRIVVIPPTMSKSAEHVESCSADGRSDERSAISTAPSPTETKVKEEPSSESDDEPLFRRGRGGDENANKQRDIPNFKRESTTPTPNCHLDCASCMRPRTPIRSVPGASYQYADQNPAPSGAETSSADSAVTEDDRPLRRSDRKKRRPTYPYDWHY